MSMPLSYMERIAALERRVSELERELRATRPPVGRIPPVLLKAPEAPGHGPVLAPCVPKGSL
jgi:hypothetical protein